MATKTVYLVSGANRGIGLGLVTRLAEDPKNIVFAGARDPSKADELAALIKKHSNVHVVKLVSADLENNQQAIAEIQKKAGQLDVVVANAGIGKGHGTAETLPLSDYRENWEVNTLGVVALYQASLPLLKKSPSGAPHFAVISTGVASISKFFNMQMAAYGASKAAANYFVVAIHHEQPNLIASAHHPGWVQTDMGNGGAIASGMEGAPVELKDSIDGILSTIIGATKEKTSGKFWNYKAIKSDKPWDIDTEEIPW
ncbi:hypothetical protein RQP46_003808 [Phenoliferia psychrophenolica]